MKDQQNVSLYKILFSIFFGIILGSVVPFISTLLLLFCNSELILLSLSIITIIVISFLLQSGNIVSFVFKISPYIIASMLFSFFIFIKNIYREIYIYFFPDKDFNAGNGLGALIIVPLSITIIISIMISLAITAFRIIRKKAKIKLDDCDKSR